MYIEIDIDLFWCKLLISWSYDLNVISKETKYPCQHSLFIFSGIWSIRKCFLQVVTEVKNCIEIMAEHADFSVRFTFLETQFHVERFLHRILPTIKITLCFFKPNYRWIDLRRNLICILKRWRTMCVTRFVTCYLCSPGSHAGYKSFI